MATRRYSVAVSGNDHTVVDAVGAAVVTAPIELTVDFDALRASGLSASNAINAIYVALDQFHAYIETSGKYNLAG
jgi:RNA:NAD 2'-phosphotransferase (TPT1/KptA family)